MKEKEKLKLYRLLGAEQFQKVVFNVERFKYKIIDNFFPNVIPWYETQYDKRYKKMISKGKIEKNKIYEAQLEKLKFRKELAYKQNRNYHYNPNYPTKFINYLEMNKKIHKKGLIKNILALSGVGILNFIFNNPFPLLSLGFIAYETVCLIVNFECINLQNYNLCRFQTEKMQRFLKKEEEKKFNANVKKLSDGMNPVAEVINSQIELPSIDQVVDKIENRTQAKQLLEYAKEQLQNMQNLDNMKKEKRIGGNRR